LTVKVEVERFSTIKKVQRGILIVEKVWRREESVVMQVEVTLPGR